MKKLYNTARRGIGREFNRGLGFAKKSTNEVSKKTMAGLKHATGIELHEEMNRFTTMYRDILVGIGDHVDYHEVQMKEYKYQTSRLEEASREQKVALASISLKLTQYDQQIGATDEQLRGIIQKIISTEDASKHQHEATSNLSSQYEELSKLVRKIQEQDILIATKSFTRLTRVVFYSFIVSVAALVLGVMEWIIK